MLTKCAQGLHVMCSITQAASSSHLCCHRRRTSHSCWPPRMPRCVHCLLLLLWVGSKRPCLSSLSSQVSTASVACGVLGVGGNKGAVAVGFTLHRRKFAVVCSHFAAHQVRACRALILRF